VNGEQLTAQSINLFEEQRIEIILVMLLQMGNKGLDLASLGVVVACGANQVGQLVCWQGVQNGRIQRLGSLQIRYRLLDVGPGNRLGENRTNNDFKAGLGWPPVLRAVMGQETLIDIHKEARKASRARGYALPIPHATLPPPG